MGRRLIILSSIAIFIFGIDLYYAYKKGCEFIEDVRKDVEALPSVKGPIGNGEEYNHIR